MLQHLIKRLIATFFVGIVFYLFCLITNTPHPEIISSLVKFFIAVLLVDTATYFLKKKSPKNI
ncbi:hypothetical protein EGX24_04865 [Enterococcus gallinarum]|nr:hypothetical protein EGX22_07680 [Enterococcus gallinarum]ROZ34492.1 hypothetical protein EGX24_04865 [Enterococcus gallinarum]